MKTSLKKGKKIEEIVGYDEVSSMYNASMRLNRIIDNFLDVSRLEAGRFDLQLKTHSTLILVQNATQNVQNLAESKDMQIIIDIQDTDLYVDEFRIEQVFTNILTNAIKYSPPRSEIWIESSWDDPFYTFTFTAQGLGFTPEELEDVWHPFSPSFLRKKRNNPSHKPAWACTWQRALSNCTGGRLKSIPTVEIKGLLFRSQSRCILPRK